MARLSGTSLRLGLLRDNEITQSDIVNYTGINRGTLSQELAGRGGKDDKYRSIIYEYYSNNSKMPVDYTVFWRK